MAAWHRAAAGSSAQGLLALCPGAACPGRGGGGEAVSNIRNFP
jgi:hypothetical protein